MPKIQSFNPKLTLALVKSHGENPKDWDKIQQLEKTTIKLYRTKGDTKEYKQLNLLDL